MIRVCDSGELVGPERRQVRQALHEGGRREQAGA
jgi:hypothetical protein